MTILTVGIDLAKNVFAVHGVDAAGSVLLRQPKVSRDSSSRWAMALWQRRGYWKAVVASAAKNARMAWAVLNKGEAFRLPA
jgi:hypothetical protein